MASVGPKDEKVGEPTEADFASRRGSRQIRWCQRLRPYRQL